LSMAHSTARALVRDTIPPLLAAYGPYVCPRGLRKTDQAISDDILTTLPRPAFRISTAARREAKKQLLRFRLRSLSQSLSFTSESGLRRLVPALFTRIVNPPNS